MGIRSTYNVAERKKCIRNRNILKIWNRTDSVIQ